MTALLMREGLLFAGTEAWVRREGMSEPMMWPSRRGRKATTTRCRHAPRDLLPSPAWAAIPPRFPRGTASNNTQCLPQRTADRNTALQSRPDPRKQAITEWRIKGESREVFIVFYGIRCAQPQGVALPFRRADFQRVAPDDRNPSDSAGRRRGLPPPVPAKAPACPELRPPETPVPGTYPIRQRIRGSVSGG